jgi:ribosomal protein S18 acetylase RimI-like enzyme
VSRTATVLDLRLRPLRHDDTARVGEITRASGLFRPDEIPVALEVMAGAAAGSPDYDGLAAELDHELVGWIAWGPTPCTLGTWDLYWLAVDPSHQGNGIGRTLVNAMEERLRPAARLIVVETAGRDDYAGTRAFYEALGYQQAARLPDFYAPGDDQVVYLKYLTHVTHSQGGR